MNSPLYEAKQTLAAEKGGVDWVGSALALLIVTACIGFSHHVGYRQFGGYDLSPVIDLLYRLHAGERPGQDFINTLPLSFVVYLDFCQKIFGVSWFALIAGGSLVFAVACGAIYYLGAPFMDRQHRLAAILVLSVPTLVTNHVWHNTFSAYVVTIFVLCLLGLLTRTRRVPRWLCWIGLGLLTGVMFYSKQNVGLPLTVLLLAYLTIRSLRFADRMAAAVTGVMIASIAATTLLFMFVLGMDFQSVVYTFQATSGRLVPTIEQARVVFLPAGAVIVHLIVLYAIWIVLRTPGIKHRRDAVMAVCACCAAVGGLAYLTNWDTKYNDVVLLLIPALLILGTSANGSTKAPGSQPVAILVGTVLIVMSLLTGAARERMYHVGPGNFYEFTVLHQIHDGIFAGLWVGPRMVAVRTGLADFMARHPDAKSTLFCGARIEFCYADTGASSPAGLPLWWHPGSSYAIRDEKLVVQRFIDHKFKYLAFTDREYLRIPKAILENVNACYMRSEHNEVIEFYQRTCH